MPGQAGGSLIPQVSLLLRVLAHHKGPGTRGHLPSLPLTHASWVTYLHTISLLPTSHPQIVAMGGKGKRVQLLQHSQGHGPQEGGRT